MFDLSGKVALITGGSRGLGRAMVSGLSVSGAQVAFCYKSDAKSAEDVVDEVESKTGHRPLAIQADIVVEGARNSLIEQVNNELGPVDILVNNAGTRLDGIALRMSHAWDDVLELDLTAPFRLSQLVLRSMSRRSWGRIINIGSIASRIGLGGQANYTAAKAGLEGLSRSLAQEYGKKGITVNTVNPGFIETDLTEDASSELRQALLSRAAIPELLSPEAVANAVVFLASGEAWAITGQTLNVDCGVVKF